MKLVNYLPLKFKTVFIDQMILTTAVQVLGLSLSFLLSVVLAREVGLLAVGIVALSRSISSVLSFFIAMGTNTLMVREVAILKASSGVSSSIFYGVIRFRAVLTCIVIFLLMLGYLTADLNSDVGVFFIVSFVLGGLTNLSGSILKGLGKTWVAFALEQVLTVFLVLSMVLLVDLVSVLTIELAAFCYLMAYCISVIVSWYFLAREFPVFSQVFNVRCSALAVLRKTKPYMIAAAMAVIMTQVDLLMLGAMVGIESVGVYSISLNLAMLTGFVLTAVNSNLSPKVARLYCKGDVSAVSSIAEEVCALYVLVGVLALVFFYVFGDLIYSIWMLEGYLPLLMTLVVGQFFRLAAGPTGMLLVMTEYAGVHMKISVAAAILNVILNYFLIQSFGLYGAAFATSLTLLFLNGASWVAVSKKLNLFVFPKYNWRHFR